MCAQLSVLSAPLLHVSFLLQACAFGLTTQGSGKGVNESSCGIALGYGNVDGTIMPCPIGTYNDVEWNANRSAECKPCGTGLTTVAEGSTSAAACNLCKPGYGGTTDCSGMCGGEGASATYGPPGRSTDTDPQCLSCTTQSTGYSFDCECPPGTCAVGPCYGCSCCSSGSSSQACTLVFVLHVSSACLRVHGIHHCSHLF